MNDPALVLVIALVAATALVACTPTAEQQDFPPRPLDVCPLPMDYAIRSSCPFSTAVIDGQCAVVCYDWRHEPDPNGRSYLVQCSADDDCSCDFFPSPDVERCGCVQGVCAAVMTRT